MSAHLDDVSHLAIVPVMVSIDLTMPTINDFIGKNRHVYNNAKIFWSEIWGHAFHGPTGRVEIRKPGTKTLTMGLTVERDGELDGLFERILVEGEVTFPKRNVGPQDQGNARGFIEKVIGDVLQKIGHLENDRFKKFSFGNLERFDVQGVSQTRLFLFPEGQIVTPALDEPESVDRVVVGW